MLQTKIKYELKKGDNSKLREARVMVHVHCTPFDEIYPPTKFHNHSLYSFEDMLRTKFKYENEERAITKKSSKQEFQFMCTALPLDEIYSPTQFHNHS